MIFSKFPREMGFPARKGKYRIVNNKEEFLEAVNLMNGKSNTYTTIFTFENINNGVPDYNSAIVDLLFFDLDSKKGFENIKKFHEELMKKDVKHIMLFSGRGFHLYIKVKPEDIKNKKDALYNIQTKILDDIRLSYGESKECDVDGAILGDIARISRVPNTYNTKGKKFCIYITEEDLKKGLEHIKEKALKQNYPMKVYGSRELSIKSFDFPSKKTMINQVYETTGSITNINDGFIKNLPPCVKIMLTEHTNHKWRYWGAIWLREMGFAEEESHAICKKYLSGHLRDDGTVNDYLHMRDSDHAFETVYHKGEHFFPHCETLKREGLCKEACKWQGKWYVK